MHVIKCLKDIELLRASQAVSAVMTDRLEIDLHMIHDWSDEDRQYAFEEFHADLCQCGFVIVFETISDVNQMEELGIQAV